jgi:hypothetical protein
MIYTCLLKLNLGFCTKIGCWQGRDITKKNYALNVKADSLKYVEKSMQKNI